MEELELIDIFRKQYPQKLSFSYESKPLKFCSKIYLFSCCSPLLQMRCEHSYRGVQRKKTFLRTFEREAGSRPVEV